MDRLRKLAFATEDILFDRLLTLPKLPEPLRRMRWTIARGAMFAALAASGFAVLLLNLGSRIAIAG